ncbi:unnamed protein product [Vicia faba]|uniref:Uncharacterized protein n=1 Tax=Vicia faba TaxID=3906 RepID=A0AAV1BC31_VICFA|nr:unnamed protein product [Vicia faba]
MPIQSKLIQDLLRFSLIVAKISLIRIPVEVILRPFSGPVKSIPKDFSDADPVNVNPRPPLVQSDSCEDLHDSDRSESRASAWSISFDSNSNHTTPRTALLFTYPLSPFFLFWDSYLIPFFDAVGL